MSVSILFCDFFSKSTSVLVFPIIAISVSISIFWRTFLFKANPSVRWCWVWPGWLILSTVKETWKSVFISIIFSCNFVSTVSTWQLYVFISGRYAESPVNGRRQKISYPFISGFSSGRSGMMLALSNSVGQCLDECCNIQTLAVVIVVLIVAFYIELLSSTYSYLKWVLLSVHWCLLGWMH